MSPCPQHVLRIHLLEAENLIAKDNFFKGVVRGRSDPYAKVRVAGRVFRSRVVKEDLNPRWNEVYEVPGVSPAPGIVPIGVDVPHRGGVPFPPPGGETEARGVGGDPGCPHR